MRKILKICFMGIMVSALMAGCGTAAGSSNTTTAAVEASTVATEAATEQEAVKDTAEDVDATEVTVETNAEGAILTTGTYEGESDFVDEDQALFTDKNGIEFVAQLSDNTTLPEGGLVKGETYVVAHSEMMTASLPGIYPEVYSITEQD